MRRVPPLLRNAASPEKRPTQGLSAGASLGGKPAAKVFFDMNTTRAEASPSHKIISSKC